ncbi:hypothetical protein RJ639_007531 [Escallonia herrerae]|uniref:MADS-box domain-containing protein n=1 Tax=Escallonia herrerae TaxID=1293975 RepID=A0AA88VXK6_9ASTE|nr:hypothetical protein RJ639_007531 [Escallonia herrerae]
MGRTKLEIKKIEDKARRQTTFTKRRQGLYKKAGELATKCGAQVAVIAFSNAGNVFAYGHPAVNTVLRRYEAATGGGGGGSRAVREEIESKYRESVAKLEAERRVEEILGRAAAAAEGGGGRPLWSVEVEKLGVDELEKLRATMEDMKRRLAAHDGGIAAAEADSGDDRDIPAV